MGTGFTSENRGTANIDTMKSRLLKPLGLALLIGWPAFAGTQNNAALEFSRPEYRERYHDLVNQLRCLVCQNQTIAESNAELAVDLRNRVREMIEQGQSDDTIIDFMASRYGDFVLYNPPLKASTMLLWFAPFIVIGIGTLTLVLLIVRRNTEAAADASASVQRRVDELKQRPKRSNKNKKDRG
jgi:cytochrome c-type biogenesis protein CcmH